MCFWRRGYEATSVRDLAHSMGISGPSLYNAFGDKHELFVRDSADLSCEVPIAFTTAALGGEVEVPTLGGHASIKVPSETQSGRVFRLKGKGVRPVRGGATGDLYCRVVVETPVKLSTEQKELLQRLDVSLRKNSKQHNPRESTWLDGVKKFFESIGQ